jgi:Xaa-Pro dipeptidase
MSFDFEGRWATATALMRARGIDAMFVMKPTNLAYRTGGGRPCVLGLLTATGRFVAGVPECDEASLRAASHATEVRSFRSEEEMFHGFRDVLAELELDEATVALVNCFFDAALHEV